MVGKLTFPAFYIHHDHAFTRGFVRRFPGEPERVRKRVRYLWKALVSKNLYQLTVSCLDFQIARTVFQPLYSEFTFSLRAKVRSEGSQRVLSGADFKNEFYLCFISDITTLV
ncbi:unnamed protein product [Brassica oleracea]